MRLRLEYIVPITYLVIFGFCLYQASSFAEGGFDWYGACMALTLPWSILTYFFFILMHLGSDSGVLIAIGLTALLNAGLLFLLFRPKRKNNTELS